MLKLLHVDSRRSRYQGVSGHTSQTTTPSQDATSMRRRLFAGMKSLTGFGSRSRQGSPGHRSISLPEKRNSQDGSGNRPFGQPLCLGPQLDEENQNIDTPSKSAPPTPTRSKSTLTSSKRSLNKTNKK
ncbi:hypothetical protein GWI33_014207 [Rhynchophorus ferrugineus]|uniref:Uncharacterized protein n=1 Tax=Rhynchophorus ferrugineus TaxID=354439 RepID=A0A834I7N9_RHYFE|nr:hypothetical protein GWI33_014207 [Rhynchophorus ferrugineus]